MTDIFIFIMLLVGSIVMLAFAGLVTIFVLNMFVTLLERIIVETVPIIADLWGRIKYPREYTRD